MATKSRQLSLDELLRLKWLLGGAMALVALWTVFFLDIEALGLVALVSAVVASALAWPQWPGRLPPVVTKLAVPAIIVVAAADFYASPDTLPALIRLSILLVLYRSVVYRRKREDLQLIVLGLFLVVVAGVLTVSLGFAVLLLLFTAVALGFLFVINLVDALQSGTLRTADAESAWQRLPWGKLLRRLLAVADWRILVFAVLLFFAVVGVSGMLFLIIPRFDIGSGFFLDRFITRQSRSGFSDTLHFGDVTQLTQDGSMAMRVDLTDASGIRQSPYWRMVVLDEYTAEGFRVSASLKNRLLMGPRVDRQIPGRKTPFAAQAVGGTWTVYVEPGVSRYLPLPGSFGVLRMRDFTPLQVSAEHRIVALRTEPVSMIAYQLEDVELDTVVSDPGFVRRMHRDAGEGDPGDRLGGARLLFGRPTGPDNEQALKAIIAEIGGGGEGAADFVARATRWIRSRHAYALSVRVPPGNDRDALVRWLDSNEPGYCEYFAAGLTVLARTAGYPARVVVGFRGGTLNAFENYFMVRNSDAHAWVEVFDGTSSWVRTDPTPGSAATAASLAATAAQGVEDSSWSARWDSLRILWYRRIVNFDSRQQVKMLEQVKGFTTDSAADARGMLERVGKEVRAWLARPWDTGRWVRTLAGAVGLVAAVWLALRALGWLGRRWRHGSAAAGFDPVREQAGRWLARLRDTAAPPEVCDDLRRLRYGRRETWPEPQSVFRRAKLARRAKRAATGG